MVWTGGLLAGHLRRVRPTQPCHVQAENRELGPLGGRQFIDLGLVGTRGSGGEGVWSSTNPPDCTCSLLHPEGATAPGSQRCSAVSGWVDLLCLGSGEVVGGLYVGQALGLQRNCGGGEGAGKHPFLSP